MPKDNLPMLVPDPMDGSEGDLTPIDETKQRVLNEYLNDVLPRDPRAPHPFLQFEHSEIVRHAEMGLGIITGYRIADFDREIEGLGVQFVTEGVMREHRVFTPAETSQLTPTGVVFEIRRHAGMTLEAVLDSEESRKSRL